MKSINAEINCDGEIWYNKEVYIKAPVYLVCPVKHYHDGEEFLFAPTSFVPRLGDIVLCETKKGLAKGVIVGEPHWSQCFGVGDNNPPSNIIELISRGDSGKKFKWPHGLNK